MRIHSRTTDRVPRSRRAIELLTPPPSCPQTPRGLPRWASKAACAAGFPHRNWRATPRGKRRRSRRAWDCLPFSRTNPSLSPPSQADAPAVAGLSDKLRQVQGPVLAPAFPSYAAAAGKPWFVHQAALVDTRSTLPALASLHQPGAVANGTFEALLLDPTEPHYAPLRPRTNRHCAKAHQRSRGNPPCSIAFGWRTGAHRADVRLVNERRGRGVGSVAHVGVIGAPRSATALSVW